MEDDTHSWWIHEESPCWANATASYTTADVLKLERTVKQLKTARFVGDAPPTEGDVDIQDDVDLEGLSRMVSEALGHDQAAVPSVDMEEREEDEVPLRPVSESADPSIVADKGKAHMPDLDIPAEFVAEDAQARQRFKEEQASERLVQRLQAEDLAQEYMPNVFEERAKALDELMMRMIETDWLNLMLQVGSNPALARELLGTDVTEENFVERMTAIKDKKKRALADLRYRALKGTISDDNCQGNPAISEPPSKRQRVARASSLPSVVPAATTQPADDHDSAAAMDSAVTPMEVYINEFFLVSDGGTEADRPFSHRSHRKRRGVRSDDFLWDKPVEDFFSSESESDDDMENYIPPLPYGAFKDWEIVRCPLSTTYYHVYYQENRRQKSFFYLKQLLPHVYREDLLLLRRRMNRYFWLNPDVDVGLDLWRDVNLCQSLHSDDVEDFWRTQDEWVVSSWKLYPKSYAHVLDLTNGKTVYMFVDKVYPIRATLLERMLRHRLTVPPSY
ncbi:hypothetical protein Tco_0007361 [Tanacetum coccineum]